MKNDHAATLRLFFALWPEPSVRAELASLLPAVQGRKVKPANLHITLAFLGRQPVTGIPALLSIAHSIPFPVMRLQIDRLGYFARRRIAWAGMQHSPPELATVRCALTDALVRAGIHFDADSPFRPHVTLARDAVAPAATHTGPVIWTPAGIKLVSSVPGPTGVAYQVLDS